MKKIRDIELYQGDNRPIVKKFLRTKRIFELILIDPPYDLKKRPESENGKQVVNRKQTDRLGISKEFKQTTLRKIVWDFKYFKQGRLSL